MKKKNNKKSYYSVITLMQNFKVLFGSLHRMVMKYAKINGKLAVSVSLSVNMLVSLSTFSPPQHIL